MMVTGMTSRSRSQVKVRTWLCALLNFVCLGATACSAPEQTVSPFNLTLPLVDEEKLVDDADEALKDEADAAALPVEEKACAFADTRTIDVVNPVRVAHYALDSLGIVETTTTSNACLTSLLRDGAQLLSRTDSGLIAFYPDRFEAFLFDFSEAIDVDAMEGRWDFAKKRVIPGIDGQKVDHAATRANFMQAVLDRASSFELAVTTTKAMSHDETAYADFDPAYKIGHYMTHFSRAKNRTSNVKLAAQSMNGTFLMPGAEFSYNELVGERSEARGFKEAPVIEQGQLVEGLGGGACQVSSTIHAAALMAGLGIEERYNHSLPSSYIPVGMDAVVSYPILDLRVKNNYDVPVVLHVTTQDDQLIAEFYSSKPRPGRVLFRKEVVEEIPFKEVVTVDPTYESGTIKVRKRGKVGYRVQRGRIFWKDGKETYERLKDDTYQSQTQQTSIAWDVEYPVATPGSL